MTLYAEDFCSSLKDPKNPNYSNAQKMIEVSLDRFSNHKTVASQADQMLSQLIAKKSPAILSWMSKRDFKNKSEDAIAREWRVYYAKNFVFSQYAQQSIEVKKMIDSMFYDLNSKLLNKDFKVKIEKYFQEAQELSLKKVQSFSIAESAKKQILEHVRKIKLYWMGELAGSKFAGAPLDWFSWGVAYDPVSSEINIGIEALRYPNEQTWIAVLTHEIAHSFDSCRWGAFYQGEFPFQKIAECLRSERSIGAKKRDDQKLALYKLPKELMESLMANPTCNKKEYSPIGVQADQLPESFADWFSAEVISASPYAKKGFRIDLCEESQLNFGSSYPKNQDRLSKIYLAHPLIRKNVGLEGDSSFYCSL